ncbi:ABC transporter substrate-binding protein [Brachyspira sp. G79]|uniref:ABC transporter substrate-binding protein n=1 Tax=Brachyspira sp. G79 TaxID=1358104 RepID=UPI000BBBF57A|nr:ABC transporter substrate-binding protein [Brachyspira sp. G79]PCG18955.1 nitrate ABC transporter [Brachyspira sp. G79]
MYNKKIVLLTLLAVLLISCANGGSKEPDVKKIARIRVGYMPDFSGTSAAAIALEKGFFEEENLNVSLIRFLDGPSEIDAMLLNNLEFAYIGHGAHTLAIKGKVNVLFPNSLSKSEQIIARAESQINTISDLRGKTVGTQFGTSSEILLNLALKTLGINQNELNIVNMDGPTIVSSMLNKTIDAAAVQAPYTFNVLKNLGDEAKTIVNTIDYSDAGAFPSSWIVTPEYQANNPDIVNRFSRAILKAMNYRTQNMDEAVAIVAKQNNTDTNAVNLEKETAVWLSGDDIQNAYIDGTASKWYKSQQNIFIYTKAITNSVDINNYVQIKYMNDNIFNK